MSVWNRVTLRAARQQAGWSLARLSAETGVSVALLSALERGPLVPDDALIATLTPLLGPGATWGERLPAELLEMLSSPGVSVSPAGVRRLCRLEIRGQRRTPGEWLALHAALEGVHPHSMPQP